MPSRAAPVVSLLLVCGLAAQAEGDGDRRAVDWMPTDAALVLSVPEPAVATARIVGVLGELPADLPPETSALLAAGLVAAGTWLGGDVVAIAEQLAVGGFAAAVVPRDGAFAVVAAMRPAQTGGATAWLRDRAPKLPLRTVGSWLLLASDAELLAECALREAAAEPPWWERPLRSRPADAVAFAAVDLALLRRLDPRRRTLLGPLDAGGRFLLGPWALTLDRAALGTLALRAGNGLELQFAVDATLQQEGPPRDALAELMPVLGGTRKVVDVGADLLAGLMLDRSLHRLLAEPAKFLPEDAVTGVDSFLSIADALDGPGTSIVADLFGRLGEPAALLVLRASPLPDDERPSLYLPDFALVVPAPHAEVESIVRRVVGLSTVIVNAERLQRHQGAITLREWRGEHGQGLVAEMPVWRGPGKPPVESALSPVVAFGAGHLVLASTSGAAERVLAACAADRFTDVAGDRLVVRGPALAEALAGSLDALVLARMLDEGESETQARRFFAVAEALLDRVAELRVAAAATAHGTTFALEVVPR